MDIPKLFPLPIIGNLENVYVSYMPCFPDATSKIAFELKNRVTQWVKKSQEQNQSKGPIPEFNNQSNWFGIKPFQSQIDFRIPLDANWTKGIHNSVRLGFLFRFVWMEIFYVHMKQLPDEETENPI